MSGLGTHGVHPIKAAADGRQRDFVQKNPRPFSGFPSKTTFNIRTVGMVFM